MNNKPVIMVTGWLGQLGSELFDIAGNYPQFEFNFSDKDEMDLMNAEQITSFFEQLKPAYFISCGAYTAVDKAETDREIALAINADAPGTIAALCSQYNTKLIHISTDYVFSGNSTEPYKEDDVTDPVNFYGYSKLLGEKLVLQNNDNTIVIRTSWVYSTYGNNFVKTMLRLMGSRPEISVVSDQVGSPTYARDLAAAIMAIVTNPSGEFTTGVYHFSNDGIISWYDFAVAIKEIKHLNCIVHPIPTTAYPTPAKRPAYSGMSKEKITSTFPIKLKGWREVLEECLAKL